MLKNGIDRIILASAILSLSFRLGGDAIAEENICDKKILNRPACEVGDFDSRHSKGQINVVRGTLRPAIPGPPGNFYGKYQAELITIARYEGYELVDGLIKAKYKMVLQLKGPPIAGQPLSVRFENSAPSKQQLDGSKMPEKGSTWIVFIRHFAPDKNGLLEPFGGVSDGILKYSRRNLDDALNALGLQPPDLPNGNIKTRQELYSLIETQ